MKLLLLLTLLVVSSGPAYAEWVAIEKNDGAGMTVYVDPDTIRHKGDLVKMWHLYDFKTVQTEDGEDPFLSLMSQSEFDCAEEHTRKLTVTWFSGNMGRDKPVYSDSNATRWKAVAPRSVGSTLWKFACGKW